MMNKDSKIYIAGHRGMVGSAILRHLQNEGFENFALRTHSELDLTNQKQVEDFFSHEKPDYVFLAAAKVGGINANNLYPAEFIYNNLIIQNNIIHCAYLKQVKKLLFLGSSCIYPRDCPQPIKEEYLLTGPLEKTNEWYAMAKIAGIKMCQAYHKQYGCNFISVMPTNLYGPGDNYNLNTSHVLPALIRKFHEALPDKSVEIWGSGKARREFLHVDDLAAACIFLMGKFDLPEVINIGSGTDVTIQNLALIIQKITGHSGPIMFNSSKPDGTPQKLLNTEKINKLGWKYKIELSDGIKSTYNSFKENY